jgi:predicted MFS family arabinose efflux permease
MKSFTSMPVSQREEETPPKAVDMRLIWLLTVTAGIAVANLYYSQPLVATIAHSFALSASQAGFLVSLTQLGYGFGLLLIVPLGDSHERRTLIVRLLLLEAAALPGITFAPSIGWLTFACLAAGFIAVVPQVIVPFAASLASEEQRARVVGVILLDLGTQTNLTSCQAIAQSLRPEARSRLNTIFMTTYFLGGAAGSMLGSYGWSLGRWEGICMIGIGLLVCALVAFLLTSRGAHRL